MGQCFTARSHARETMSPMTSFFIVVVDDEFIDYFVIRRYVKCKSCNGGTLLAENISDDAPCDGYAEDNKGSAGRDFPLPQPPRSH